MIVAAVIFFRRQQNNPIRSADAIPLTAVANKVMVAAILEIREVVTRGNSAQIRAAIDTFRDRAIAGDLVVREREGEIADAEYVLSVLAYLERIDKGEGLQAIATMSDGEPSFYRNPKVYRRMVRDDDIGSFDIGDKGIFFNGEKKLTIVWSKVLTIGVDRESLTVHPSSGGNPNTFGLRNSHAARLAHIVATTILKDSRKPRRHHVANERQQQS